MLSKYLKYFILILSVQYTIAQKEATHWYFGEKTGLDFTSGSPMFVNDKELRTDEECATISDATDSFLFPIPTYSYHLTLLDTKENTYPIIDIQNFSNTITGHIFIKVENQLNCHAIAYLQLQVSITQITDTYMIHINEYDDRLIDGDVSTFDLSYATQEFIDLFSPDQKLKGTYFLNLCTVG